MAAALLPLPLPLALRAEFPLTTICAFIAHALPRPPPPGAAHRLQTQPLLHLRRNIAY